MLTKQLCLIKITQPKQVIPTKSYSLAILHLPHTKYSYHVRPQFQPSNWYILLTRFSLFNSYAIHERKPWIQHYGGIRYNGRGYVGRQKRRKSHINEANQRAMEMPINSCQHEEQGLPCNGCTRAMYAQQKKTSGCASNSLAHEDLGHLRKPIVGIYKPSSLMKTPTSI